VLGRHHRPGLLPAAARGHQAAAHPVVVDHSMTMKANPADSFVEVDAVRERRLEVEEALRNTAFGGRIA
jgi:hypothetical protein